ncbi:MAG: family transcriptional regulator, cyclic receptor protein [Acidobacteriota bacterium]|nr:family transcriptional regulator, cyclic receptor protein [Acidobacteriota bacterium]
MSRSIIETTLAERETLVRFRTGETLFREGEEPRGVYVLHSGTVHLLFAGRNGSAKPLREAQPGQILGLSCVVTRRHHDCTAVAAEPCEAAFIESDDFLRVLDDSPAVWFSVLRVLSSEVSAVYDDMRVLAAR